MNINTNMAAASRPCSDWYVTLPEAGRSGMSAPIAAAYFAAPLSQDMYAQVLVNGTDAFAATPQITRDHDVPAFTATSTKLGIPPRGVPR